MTYSKKSLNPVIYCSSIFLDFFTSDFLFQWKNFFHISFILVGVIPVSVFGKTEHKKPSNHYLTTSNLLNFSLLIYYIIVVKKQR
jgi:hypothetical protein